MKRILATVLMLMAFVSFTAKAQDEEKTQIVSGGVSWSPRYIWRGYNIADGMMFTPTVSLNVGGFNLLAESIIQAADDPYYEVNLYASYTWKGLSVGLNDYYSPYETGKYFDFDNHTTDHILEAQISYAPEFFPVWASFSTYIWGADKDMETGKQYYSSYAEIGGYYDFQDESSLSLTLGAGIRDGAFTMYEGKNFAICNVDLTYSKTIEFEHCSLPLSASLVANPLLNKMYLNCAIGIEF